MPSCMSVDIMIAAAAEMLPTTGPWKFSGHFDFHHHDRLQQHRLHLRERLAEAVLERRS